MFIFHLAHALVLSIQYRMHPDISVFPSTTFYDSKLQDGPGMAQLTAQPWHSNPLFRPFKFFASRGLEAAGRSHSLINREEAAIAQAIYERLRQDHPKVDFDYRIGIVTMYKEQVFELKRVFRARYGADIDSVIDFNTVDGFQGQEKDIIILSCVRGGKGTVGFLSDRRRVNVALTRAKSNMFVIGNAEHLRNDRLWGQLVVQSEARGALQPANVKTFSGVSRPAPAPARQPPTQKARPPQGQPPPPPPAGLATPKQLAQRYGADQSSPNAKKRAAPDAQNDESSNPAKKSRVPSGNSSARPSEDSLFDGPLSSNNPSKTSSPAPGSRHSSAGPRPDRRGPATVPPRERAAGDARGHGPPGRHTGRPDDPNGRPNRPPPGGPHGPNGQPARPSGSGPGAQPPRPPAPPPQKRPPPVSAAPPKPSNKALDAMFVKKRR